MRVALLSDAHVAGPEDPRQARLLRFLDGLRVDRLCLLGDVFHHWWHFGGEPFAGYAPVVTALRGRPLVFVPGNHDWHAAGFFARELGATVGAPVRETWDGLRVHLGHGDEVDTSLGYRATTAALRSRPFAAAMDAAGPALAWRTLGRLAGRLGDRGPDEALCAAQVERARSYLATGAELVAFGHTHAPGVHRLPEGIYVNLGDWVTHHTWLLVDDGHVDLKRYDG